MTELFTKVITCTIQTAKLKVRRIKLEMIIKAGKSNIIMSNEIEGLVFSTELPQFTTFNWAK